MLYKGPEIQYIVSVIDCNSRLKPFKAGQVLNWNNNHQEVILLITSNGCAPISPQLSNPICRAEPLRRQHSEQVGPTAGNAKRQMVKYNRASMGVFVQGHDPVLHSQAISYGKRSNSCLQLPLSTATHTNGICSSCCSTNVTQKKIKMYFVSMLPPS